jgi:hypothetical protein
MGLWQFERGGGVAGVLSHPKTGRLATAMAEARGVEANASAVHPALSRDDVLACVFARLLLWTDPRAMPSEMDAGWSCYLRNWRPGKPHFHAWGDNWRLAQEAVGGA